MSYCYWILFFACLCAAVGCKNMPRCWSAEVLALRRQRAIDRGYMRARPGRDRKRMEVPTIIAPRVKAMAKSLEWHVAHELAVGKEFHYARHAALAAKELIGDSQYKKASAAHKAANSAKHCSRKWADAVDDACDEHPRVEDSRDVSSELSRATLSCDSQVATTAKGGVMNELEALRSPMCYLSCMGKGRGHRAQQSPADIDSWRSEESLSQRVRVLEEQFQIPSVSEKQLESRLVDLLDKVTCCMNSTVTDGMKHVLDRSLEHDEMLLKRIVSLEASFEQVSSQLQCLDQAFASLTSQSRSVDSKLSTLISRDAKMEAFESQVRSMRKQIEELEHSVTELRTQCAEEESFSEFSIQHVCQYFLRGQCRFGDRCKFKHTQTLESLGSEDSEGHNIPVDATVLIQGLQGSTHLNQQYGLIEKYHATSGRFEVRYSADKNPVLIKRANLLYPAQCPECKREVTGSQCFACPRGLGGTHDPPVAKVLRKSRGQWSNFEPFAANDLATHSSLSKSKGSETQTMESEAPVWGGTIRNAEDDDTSVSLNSVSLRSATRCPGSVASVVSDSSLSS